MKGMTDKQSGFWMYLEQKIRPMLMAQNGRRRLSGAELSAQGAPYWMKLSEEERQFWKDKAKEFNNSQAGASDRLQKRAQYRQRKHNAGEAVNLANLPSTSKTPKPSKVIPPSGRYDEVDFCTRVYFAGVDDDFEGKREQDVKDLFDRFRWKFNPRCDEACTQMRNYFIDKELCVATVNIYYEDEERILPSELSLLKFSIRKGIFAQKNIIIGLTDYKFPNEMCEQDAKEQELRTGISADPEKMREVARFDFENIWKEVKEFTQIGEPDAKLLVLADDWNFVVGSFYTLFTHVNETEFCRVETRFITIQDYCLAMESLLTKVHPSEEAKSVIGTEFREKWTGAVMFDIVICELHTPLRFQNECQAKECSLLSAHEAAFNFFTVCQKRILPDYAFNGSHMPHKSQLPQAECEVCCHKLSGRRGRSLSHSRQESTSGSLNYKAPVDVNLFSSKQQPKSILHSPVTRSKSTVPDRQLLSEQNFRSERPFQPQNRLAFTDRARSQPNLMQFSDEDLVTFDDDDCRSVSRVQEVSRHPFIDPRVVSPVVQQFTLPPSHSQQAQSQRAVQPKNSVTGHDGDGRWRFVGCTSPTDPLWSEDLEYFRRAEFGRPEQSQTLAPQAERLSTILQRDPSNRTQYSRDEIQKLKKQSPPLSSTKAQKASSQAAERSVTVERSLNVSDKAMNTFASQLAGDLRSPAANHYVQISLNEFAQNSNEQVDEELVPVDARPSFPDSDHPVTQSSRSQSASTITSASTIADESSLGGFSALNVLLTTNVIPRKHSSHQLLRAQSNGVMKREHDLTPEPNCGRPRNFKERGIKSTPSAASSSLLCGTRNSPRIPVDMAAFIPETSKAVSSGVRFELDGQYSNDLGNEDIAEINSSAGRSAKSHSFLTNQQLQQGVATETATSTLRSADKGYSVSNKDARCSGEDIVEDEHRPIIVDEDDGDLSALEIDDTNYRRWLRGNELLSE